MTARSSRSAASGGEWETLLFDGAVPFNVHEHGDTLEHFLGFVLRDVFGESVTGWGFASIEGGYEIELVSPGVNLSSRLRFRSVAGGMEAVIAGDWPPDPLEVMAWTRVVEATLNEVSGAIAAHPWNAVIGSPFDSDTGVTIGDTAKVGPFTLLPTADATDVLDLGPAIVVRGETGRTSWIDGRRHASTAVRIVAALLSLAWRQPVDQLRRPRRDVDRRQDPMTLSRTHEELAAPDWLDEAWIVCARDPVSRSALLAYHEGVLLLEHHPSFAFVRVRGGRRGHRRWLCATQAGHRSRAVHEGTTAGWSQSEHGGPASTGLRRPPITDGSRGTAPRRRGNVRSSLRRGHVQRGSDSLADVVLVTRTAEVQAACENLLARAIAGQLPQIDLRRRLAPIPSRSGHRRCHSDRPDVDRCAGDQGAWFIEELLCREVAERSGTAAPLRQQVGSERSAAGDRCAQGALAIPNAASTGLGGW